MGVDETSDDLDAFRPQGRGVGGGGGERWSQLTGREKEEGGRLLMS